jgi:predicted nucleic acid-binding protein
MTQAQRLIPLYGRRIFVDSGAYLGVIDQDDQHHQDATLFLTDLVAQHYRQFTTNAVLVEAHALILSNVGIAAAGRFLRTIRQGNTVVVRVSSRDEARAEEILFRYTDRDFSFTDALSFAVMERLHITYAFAFDKHFREYGMFRYGIDA